MKTLNTIVIGLGKQSMEDHLPAVELSSRFNLLAVVDVNNGCLKSVVEKYKVKGYNSLEKLLSEMSVKPDVAIVAVPHNEYLPIIELLAKNKINIIKEKPFAVSIEEAKVFEELAKTNNIGLYVTLQRRFNPIFTTFNQMNKYIGTIYSIEGRYTMNIPRLDEGWRAQKETAGGGALIDMGYHFVDLINWYFGLPTSISCKLSSKNRDNQEYNVEDTAHINFSYNDAGGDENRVLGNLIISRVYPKKEESITVYGSSGSVQVRRGRLSRKDIDGKEVEALERQGSWPSATTEQLEKFADYIINGNKKQDILTREYLEHIAFIEASYASNRKSISIDPNIYLKGGA